MLTDADELWLITMHKEDSADKEELERLLEIIDDLVAELDSVWNTVHLLRKKGEQ